MILITGNTGYIGTVMTEYLKGCSYDILGLDNNYYKECKFYPEDILPSKQINKDIRDISERDLKDVTAIIHLAALSNDPLGELNPSLTHEINYISSIKLARLAKSVGIDRYILSSSCSVYGIASTDSPITEEGYLNPLTTYAKAKAEAERELSKLADENFHPVFMRNATVYGLSPSLRLDLVVNNLVAWAYLTGKISIMSDGTPWRPIIHVEDFCRAFLAVLEAPSDKIHNNVFNVGSTDENYQIRDIAEKIGRIVPNSQVEILNKTGSDERSYRVDFSKLKKTFTTFRPIWNLEKGIRELYQAYKEFGLTLDDFKSPNYFRVKWINYLIESNRLDRDLRWLNAKAR